MNNREIALMAAKVLDSKKAQDVVIIDISAKSSFADYFVISTANSDRQMEALADDVRDAFEEAGIDIRNTEGKKSSGWILLDFGDVIVNVLTAEMRRKYNIEKVWADCEIIEPEE